MLDPTLPTVVIRDAWSRIRLTHIQKAVESTILELEEGADKHRLAHSSGKESLLENAAHEEALSFCLSELRTEVGLDGATSTAPIATNGPHYDDYLLHYRHTAAEGLRRRLGVSPALVDQPSAEDQGIPGGLRASFEQSPTGS